MDAQRPVFDERHPGDRQVTVGAVIFGFGLLAAVVTVIPLFLGSSRFPVEVYALSVLAPLGLGLALTGMVRGSRSRRR